MNDFLSRYNKILFLLLALSIILLVRLFILTVIQSNDWSEAAEGISTRNISTTAPRGDIYDRNGNLLAGNKQTFTVKMSSEDMTDKELNRVIKKLIGILEDNGDSFEDNLPIKEKNGNYYYTYETEINKWLKKKGFPEDYTAEEAFFALRDQLGIDKQLDRYDVQLEMQNMYNEYPPISVTRMKYNPEIEKEEFLESYGLGKNVSAEKAFKVIRKEMGISQGSPEKEARKIMAVRNELEMLGYKKYMPATVSKNVSDDTVMIIEENSSELQGVETASETTRYYPAGKTASHILGYMGKISEDKEEEYEEKGYEKGAVIGLSGIESKYESILKGINGARKVQVNAYGDMVKEISDSEPEKGKDIYLTLDLDLQKSAEESLEQGLSAIGAGGGFKSKYGSAPISKAAPAQVGAVVALEVETGDVLAMSSYPDYDPNLFAEGISEKDWDSLQSENPRDPLAPSPLYKVATQSAVQPGSTFKMVTATAGLECGLDPYRLLRDGGHIEIGNKTFACVVWNMSKSTHGYVDLADALEASCNYYFYDVATGKDWADGGSLGYKKKITVDTVTDYASQYGLGEATGIEIPEAVVPVPSEERKTRNLKTSLENVLYAAAETYFKPKIVKNKELLEESIEKIISWVGQDIGRAEMINERLPDLGVRENQIEPLADLCLYTYFNQADWSVGDAMNIAIGQGENAYTPLQMANYIATIGNEGRKHKVSVGKRIEDEGQTEEEETEKVKVSSDKYFDQIREGMKQAAVGSRGSLGALFRNFPVEVAAKTGTAERGGYVPPKSEVTYIKQHLYAFDSSLSWSKIKKEMNRLMKEYPETYTNENTAVRRAVINLSKRKITTETLDQFKSTYDNFAWVVAMAPADDPKIAVCVMVVQGGTAANAGPIAREVIGDYLNVNGESIEYNTYKNETGIQ